MKHIIPYTVWLLVLTLSACNRSAEDGNAKVMYTELAAPSAAMAPQAKSPEIVERKLIKEGRVEFETDDLHAAREIVLGAVKKYNGYVSSDQEFNLPDRESTTVVVRIPADDFDAFLADATTGVNRFKSKSINVRDVTEEFLDVEARLKTKKALEARYLELLGRASKVTEILEIEKEIGQLRAEIESIEGRLKYLRDQVAFSTLTITFYERIPSQTHFGGKFKEALVSGWDNLVWFFVLMTSIWPFIVIAFLAVIGVRFYRRRKMRTDRGNN